MAHRRTETASSRRTSITDLSFMRTCCSRRTVESGAPTGTTVYTYRYADFYLQHYGPTEPADHGDDWLEGRGC